MNEEVWLKGAGLAMGYWREGHIVPLTNAEGWFQTKDKAQWLDDELVIQGRLDNMFISGGENIQPEEIEKVIAQSDFVKQVFVLPKHDEGILAIALSQLLNFIPHLMKVRSNLSTFFYKGDWNDLSNLLPTMNSRRI